MLHVVLAVLTDVACCPCCTDSAQLLTTWPISSTSLCRSPGVMSTAHALGLANTRLTWMIACSLGCKHLSIAAHTHTHEKNWTVHVLAEFCAPSCALRHTKHAYEGKSSNVRLSQGLATSNQATSRGIVALHVQVCCGVSMQSLDGSRGAQHLLLHCSPSLCPSSKTHCSFGEGKQKQWVGSVTMSSTYGSKELRVQAPARKLHNPHPTAPTMCSKLTWRTSLHRQAQG